ncbi:MAG: 2-phospho-L-lactate guanylyltransferase [Chloroflexi bacterium]|nr:MAG: 2-phospho-L-lactate guanylyltransferase [Chloroflexota bacterium]
MTTWAIIPVKTLHLSKSRLAPYLSPRERAVLMRGLLNRLLQVLRKVPQVDGIVVVSRDQAVNQIVAQHDVHFVAENEGVGLNEAVNLGRSYAVAQGATAILIMPADLPYVTLADVGALWGETAVISQQCAIICSDRHQEGTNALLLPATVPFQFQYGLQSFQKHCREAERLHLTVQEVVIPGLQFDLDTLQDWELFKEQKLICGPVS